MTKKRDRSFLKENGWEHVRGSGWAPSGNIAEDQTGNCQFYSLEDADELENRLQREAKEAAEWQPDPLDDIAIDAT